MAVLDPSDRELLAEEDAGGQDDQAGEREIEGVGAESKRLPTVADEGEDRQREGDDLVEEEDKAERTAPSVEEDGKRLRTGIPVSLGDVVGDRAEEEETEGIRDQEGEESRQSELDGELDREEEAESPDPGESDGVPPEQGVEGA